VLQCVAECCSVLQCVAVCCSVLQCVAVCCSVLQCAPCKDANVYVLQCVAECVRVLQSVAECCRVLQCVAVCFAQGHRHILYMRTSIKCVCVVCCVLAVDCVGVFLVCS